MTTTPPRQRTGLSRGRVLSAAVELADAEGVESLTMRALAERLGVEAMSLYHHVANKAALLDKGPLAALRAGGRSSAREQASPSSRAASAPPSLSRGRARWPQSFVTGEKRSSSRLVPSEPKSTFATAFWPAPSIATTVPRP